MLRQAAWDAAGWLAPYPITPQTGMRMRARRSRPQSPSTQPQHLCLDLGYDKAAVAQHGYLPHLRRIGIEKDRQAALCSA